MMFKLGKTVKCLPLLAVLVLLFAACGDDNNAVVPDTGVIAPAGDAYYSEPIQDVITEAPTEQITAPATVNAPPATSPATVGTTAQPATSAPTTSPATTAVVTTEKKLDLSSMSLKEIQDALFNTEDPNVADQILRYAGFDYDAEQGIYYSTLNPIQRFFGFNVIYDIAAPRTGMVYQTSKIYFNYNSKDWMIQLWKGQYGITVGAEIGVYNKPETRSLDHYDCVTDEEMLEMEFQLYKDGKLYFTRGPERHWWLTGFKLLDISTPIQLTMYARINFDNKDMADAFQKAVDDMFTITLTYTRDKNAFDLKWL